MLARCSKRDPVGPLPATVMAVLLGSLFVFGQLVPIAVTSDAGMAAAAGRASNRVGNLTVVRAFLPQPASPNVASVYLTVRNSGSRADVLVAASTPDALASMLMIEKPDGSMAMLAYLRIPAHGQASLVPGQDHLMLEVPRTNMKLGRRVPVTLRFLHAGTLTITVPVVPLSWIEKGKSP